MLTRGAGPLDLDLMQLAYAGDQPTVASIARLVTFFGEGEVLVTISLIAGLALLWRGEARLGLALIAVTIIGRILVWAQKYGFARLRPGEDEHLVVALSPAFPSAHAANSMIVFLTMALVFSAGSRWRRTGAAVAVALSLLVGASRVVLGVHWPSDVVGGWSFGLLWVLIALPLAERVAGARR